MVDCVDYLTGRGRFFISPPIHSFFFLLFFHFGLVLLLDIWIFSTNLFFRFWVFFFSFRFGFFLLPVGAFLRIFTDWLFLSLLVPPPRQLTLERQLNKSILIGWNHPEGAPPESGQIASYHVYVDGILRTTIRAGDRCRALIEGVDSSKVKIVKIFPAKIFLFCFVLFFLIFNFKIFFSRTGSASVQ